MLVHEQGVMIDNIEANVNDAQDYVGKATGHLGSAQKKYECRKDCLCWSVIIGIIILIIVIVVLLIVLK